MLPAIEPQFLDVKLVISPCIEKTNVSPNVLFGMKCPMSRCFSRLREKLSSVKRLLFGVYSAHQSDWWIVGWKAVPQSIAPPPTAAMRLPGLPWVLKHPNGSFVERRSRDWNLSHDGDEASRHSREYSRDTTRQPCDDETLGKPPRKRLILVVEAVCEWVSEWVMNSMSVPVCLSDWLDWPNERTRSTWRIPPPRQ